jgi:hypothetical protein
MTKKIYICGDSFGCLDPEFDTVAWPTKLGVALGNDYEVVNLSIVCASNLHIRIQVQQAIECHADYVIVLITSCIREQGLLHNNAVNSTDLLARFFKIGSNDEFNKNKDLACYSIHSFNETCVFDPADIELLKSYHTRFFDLDLAIFQNQAIIESALWSLRSHCIPFVFDQGGFQNTKFDSNIKPDQYFKEFIANRSEINLWNICTRTPHQRPYHHMPNQAMHDMISEYYAQKISCYFKQGCV